LDARILFASATRTRGPRGEVGPVTQRYDVVGGMVEKSDRSTDKRNGDGVRRVRKCTLENRSPSCQKAELIRWQKILARRVRQVVTL
jgi:hypothetical protein